MGGIARCRIQWHSQIWKLSSSIQSYNSIFYDWRFNIFQLLVIFWMDSLSRQQSKPEHVGPMLLGVKIKWNWGDRKINITDQFKFGFCLPNLDFHQSIFVGFSGKYNYRKFMLLIGVHFQCKCVCRCVCLGRRYKSLLCSHDDLDTKMIQNKNVDGLKNSSPPVCVLHIARIDCRNLVCS